MSDGGKITISVTHSRNQETIRVKSTGMSGGTPVNNINSQVTYSSRTPNTTPVIYWDGIMTRAIAQIS